MSHPEDLLLPYATGELADHRALDVQTHLATCASCAQAVIELRDMHNRLTAMPKMRPGLPPPMPARRRGRLWLVTAGTAAAVALMAAGAGAMWWWSRPAPPSASGLYALVFYEPVAVRAMQTDDARRDRYRRFGQWQRPLAARTVSGIKLVDESGRFYDSPSQVRAADRTALPGLALSGLIVVRGDSYEEVSSFVKDCPVFEDGGQVEVRRIR